MEYYRNEKQRTAVALPIFICCIVLCTLIGLAAGLMLMKNNAAAASPLASAASPTAAPVKQVSSVSDDTKSELAQEGYTRAQIVELSAPSVVGIDVTVMQSNPFYGNYESEGSGSGVIISEDGYIATCAHVVDGASKITVTLNDDVSYEAELIGTDARNDLAIIKIEATGLQAASIGDSDMLTVGEDVIAIGNPLGELRGTATSGIISAVRRTIEVEGTSMELIQTDAAISPGNSGGGLFDSKGCLIGIVNAKVSDSNAEGLGFAIPVNSVLTEINDLMTQGYVSGRAYLGVYTQNVTVRNNGGWFSSGTYCVQVTQLVGGGAAETAGIKVGDLILAVDERTISSNSDLSEAITAYNAGDKATLSVQRDGQQLDIEVTFSEYIPQK